MRVSRWLLLGALAGLVAGIVVDSMLHLPTAELRIVQLLLVVFGAAVSAFVFEGARIVTAGMNPNLSTDPPRRRWFTRASRRS